MPRNVLRWINSLGGGSSSLLWGGLGVIFLFCVARMLGLWEGIELKTLDFFLRWRPAEATDERITLLEFNDADIQALRTYPVPDTVIADLLTELQSYHPRIIGLDIFRDIPATDPFQENTGSNQHQALIQLIKNSSDVIVIEKILNSYVAAPPGVPEENIGFADAVIDDDGFVRRSLLASHSEFIEGYRLSLTIQLASRYLAEEDLSLDNGIRDPAAMRFGATELFRLESDSGGYLNQDTGGNPVVLINFRNGKKPFNRIAYSDFKAGKVPREWLSDRIVIIGMTATSTKDYLNSAAISSLNPGLVPGMEIQAHAVSQIISAVLDGRPILKTWAAPWEYFWIVIWGLMGIVLVHSKKSIPATILAFIVIGVLPIALGYGLIFVGFWIPVLPVFAVYFLNGGSAILYQIYQHEQDWKIRLDERQRIIEQSYNTIHNGPLQALKGLIRKVSSDDTKLSPEFINHELNNIDGELRSIYEFMQRESLTLQTQIYVTRNYAINLNGPLHELLYQVYRNKIQESSSYFDQIKIKITDFHPIDASLLNLEDKENIIRFLEEALCNVEQHAIGITRLSVICKQEQNDCVVQVMDNGTSRDEEMLIDRKMRGRGTRQAEALARSLGGRFVRRSQTPKGTVCWLIWPVQPPPSWRLWQRRIQQFSERLVQR